MSREKKTKINVDAPSQRLTADNPFAALSSLNLPTSTAAETIGSRTTEEPVQSTKPKPGRAVLRKETAGRSGKDVLVIDAFSPSLPDTQLHNLARQLKAHCGCGGTVRDQHIELQGLHVAKVREFLGSLGYRIDGIR